MNLAVKSNLNAQLEIAAHKIFKPCKQQLIYIVNIKVYSNIFYVIIHALERILIYAILISGYFQSLHYD